MVGAGAVVIGLGLQYALADTGGSWTPAPSSPPSGNVAAPINVSSTAQAKMGGLALGTVTPPSGGILANVVGILNANSVVTQLFQYTDGANDTGKILMATSSTGLAQWVSTSTLGLGSGSNTIVYINPVTVATVSVGATWTTASLSSVGLPSNVSAVILGTTIDAYNDQADVGIYMRADSSHPTYKLAGTETSGGGAPSLSGFNQGIYPISASKTFDYEADSGASGSIVLVGYIVGSGPTSTVYVGGVTSITAGGNITVSGSGANGTGNVTINTTATQSSGTVGGGCSVDSIGTITNWGVGTCTLNSVKYSGIWYYGVNPSCSSTYTAQVIQNAYNTITDQPIVALCLKN